MPVPGRAACPPASPASLRRGVRRRGDGSRFDSRRGPAGPDGITPPLRLLSSQLFASVVLALIAIWLAVGCGRRDLPPLGQVSGTVTLNGVPLPAALVVFTPDGPGRSAQAVTDTAGRYELLYLRDIAGADVGGHTVRITTAAADRRGREILPSRYHRKTELAALVEPGDNLIDFALQSK